LHCPSVAELPAPPPGKTSWPWTEESPQLPDIMPGGSPWPRVSIVTPSYNQAQFIEETIRSVLLQGYPNLEYIIMDGGSTDGSVEIIRQYEPWLAHWASEKDRGQSHAINKGWGRAGGDYLGWLNSDDIYYPSMIATMATSLAVHAEAHAVYSDCVIVDEASMPRHTQHLPEFSLATYVLGDYLPQQTALFRRETILALGGIDESFRYTMDFDLWLRLGSRYKIKRVPGAWAAFRIAQNTKSVVQGSGFGEEARRALGNLYATPDLPPAVKALQPRAVANTYLGGACRAFAAGDAEAGSRGVAQAIRQDPSLLDQQAGAIFSAVLGWASYPIMPDPLDYLVTALTHLPWKAGVPRRAARRALADGSMRLVFEGHARGAQDVVKRALPHALANDPSWLRNRGVWSVMVEAYLGHRVAAGLRTAISGMGAAKR
jgi:hypothetical protein